MIRWQSWREEAACQDTNPRIWFPDGAGGLRAAKEAKAICARCSVRVDCLTHALSHPEPYGTWGGMTETERDRTARRRTS